jgi:hypothetical protein
MFNTTNKMNRKLLDALMKNDVAAAKPAALRLHRTAKNSFRLVITDDSEEELAEVMVFDFNVGESVTMTDLHRMFEVKISPEFK